MWVKAEVDDAGIHFYWQQRTIAEKGEILVFDWNGEVESRHKYGEFQYGDLYRSFGSILFDASFVENWGADYDAAIESICSHVLKLVILGYGDNPEQIVGWFRDMESMEFLVESDYQFVVGRGSFLGMDGTRVSVSIDDDIISIHKDGYDYTIDDTNVAKDFVLSTFPV